MAILKSFDYYFYNPVLREANRLASAVARKCLLLKILGLNC